jgi:hypothetical protein
MDDRTDPELPGKNLKSAKHDGRTRLYDPDNPEKAFVEADTDALVSL